MHCDIYKSSKKDEMYLYVARPDHPNHDENADPLEVLSEPVRIAFGRATHVMHLELTESRKLARVNVLHVIDSLTTKGFFLQMPPEGLINPNAAEPEGYAVLDQLSGIWANFLELLDSIPEDNIAITVYILGTLLILWCWYSISKRLPSPLGGITWIIVFAVLATPTISEGPNSAIAPAIFGLLFGILTKDSALIWSNIALIAFVMGVGLIIGFFWSKYKSTKNTQANAVAKNISPL